MASSCCITIEMPIVTERVTRHLRENPPESRCRLQPRIIMRAEPVQAEHCNTTEQAKVAALAGLIGRYVWRY